MRLPLLAELLTTAALLVVGCRQPPSAPPDVIYTGARILTLDAASSVAEAVAVRGGRFVAVGSNAAIERLAARDTRRVDLGGRTVLPGFVDGHAHPSLAVRMIEKYVDVRIATTPSVAAALGKIAERAERTTDGAWVIAAASSSSQTRYAERRLPSRAELDRAAPHHPVMFLNGAHEAVVNTRGLRTLGVTRGTQHLRGAFIELDASGEPTGVVLEGMGLFPDLVIPEADLLRYYARSIPELWNAHGYTSVQAIAPLHELAALRTLAERGPTTLRYTVAVFTDPGGKRLPASFDGLEFPASVDPAWYRFGGIKVWVDSDVPVRGGAVRAPYAGPAGGYGVLNVSQDELDALVARVHGAGLPFLAHATGDRATDMALTAFERLGPRAPGAALLRIEHFGQFLLAPGTLERTRRLGVAANVQPGWLATLARSTLENLGAERAESGFAFRSMIDAGLEPGFGTDLTGIVLETLDPFLHAGAAVTRDSDAGPFVPAQSVTVTEALEMLTLWSARAQGEGHLKGSIEPGKLADMVVVSEDVTAIAPARLREVRVLKTIVGGQLVFDAGS